MFAAVGGGHSVGGGAGGGSAGGGAGGAPGGAGAPGGGPSCARASRPTEVNETRASAHQRSRGLMPTSLMQVPRGADLPRRRGERGSDSSIGQWLIFEPD